MIAAGGLVALPYAFPPFPLPVVPTYLRILGGRAPRPEQREEGNVPQLVVGVLRWEERVAGVPRAFAAFSPQECHCVAIRGAGFPQGRWTKSIPACAGETCYLPVDKPSHSCAAVARCQIPALPATVHRRN